ncbi:hypothetical protein F1913_22455, partial [Mycobacterium tuberculosis]
LAGNRPRLVWYAPDHIEGEMSSPSSLSDLIPENVHWTIWQLWLVVLLVALWSRLVHLDGRHSCDSVLCLTRVSHSTSADAVCKCVMASSTIDSISSLH